MIDEEMNSGRLIAWRAQLEARCEELSEQVKPLLAELERTKQQLELVRRLAALDGNSGVSDEADGANERLRSSIVVKPTASVSDVIAQIIGASARAMHISEIKAAYLETGRTVPGKGTESNLLAYITRDSRFRRVSKGTYALHGNAGERGRAVRAVRRSRRRAP